MKDTVTHSMVKQYMSLEWHTTNTETGKLHNY